ncbi:hypothetical protein FPV67DRAFT_1653743 [Lyophyllum atratum]|nr:hypothetical protein FPV67DRAFT_1653743 [Lyophyllum atratum]
MLLMYPRYRYLPCLRTLWLNGCATSDGVLGAVISSRFLTDDEWDSPMWSWTSKAAKRPAGVISLPHRQSHSASAAFDDEFLSGFNMDNVSFLFTLPIRCSPGPEPEESYEGQTTANSMRPSAPRVRLSTTLGNSWVETGLLVGKLMGMSPMDPDHPLGTDP